MMDDGVGQSTAMTMDKQSGQDSTAAMVRRFLPLVVLAVGFVLFFALGLHSYISLESLGRHREAMLAFVADNTVLASATYLGVYAVVVALSVPGAAVLTIFGGFLFGIIWGSALVVVGATAGAVAVFLAARTALGESLRRRAGPWAKRLEAGFRRDAVAYLLTLRLIPIFPFWLVNLVPAILGVRLRTYALTTLIGILPGTVIIVSVGNGLGVTLDAGGTPDLGILFQPAILLPLLGLALLSLAPVIYKRLRAGRPEV